jgi:transmembrane sensor
MMSYKNYNVEDFLAEESFQQYCITSNETAIAFWNKVLQQEPQIEETFKVAISWYNLLNANQGNLQQQTERLIERIQQSEQEPDKRPIKLIPVYRKWWAAASIILILIAGSYFYFRQSPHKQIAKTEDASKRIKNDVAPGGNKAVLTLANGSQIILDSAKNGAVSKQGNTIIVKLDDGKLAYKPVGLNGEIIYNTISTPRGGQYEIVLADGSKVWLNAASSLKFPAAFVGKERNVELTGEGYFEVAKNPSKPFKIKVNDATIEVLGTHFNINSYTDEVSVKTTLLEGSLKVNKGNASIILTPGQQAQIINSGKIVLNKDVDVNAVMAWKEGFFEFENIELPAIMRQIERWYDVSVQYEHTDNKERFGGRISRNLSLSNVLHLLETNGVRFKLDGNKITVL